jgi:hypothetical protein
LLSHALLLLGKAKDIKVVDSDYLKRLILYFAQDYSSGLLKMLGKCEQCGMTDVEVKTIKIGKNGEVRTLCNQCRPVGGAYAY